MPTLLTNHTHPKSPDIAVTNAKTSSLGTSANQDLDSVLSAVDQTIANNAASSSSALSTEITNRTNADTNLQNQINTEITDRTNADSTEATARANADSSEATTRASADTLLQTELDGERSPLRMSVSGKTLVIASASATRTDSSGNTSTLSIPNGSLLSDFGGATIDFSAGTIVYTNGNQSNGSFSLINFSGNASTWAKYAIVLLPGVPNSLLILNGSSFAASAALANAPAFSGGVAIGIIAVQDNGSAGSGTINNLLQSSINQFAAAGSGGSGSGSGSPLDPEDNSFTYYTRSDFKVDSNKFEDSTTGTDQILGLGKVILNVGQTFTSKDLTGQQIYDDALSILQAQVKLLYNTGKVDTNPTIQFSQDGGNSFQSATQVSLPASDGNIVLGNMVWTPSSTALYFSGFMGGSYLTATNVAAIFSPTYRTLATSFQVFIATPSTSGTITAKIYSVSAGNPQTVLVSCDEIYAAGQGLVNSSGNFITFTPTKPITFQVGVQYALSVEGTGATVSFGIISSSPSFSYGASTYSGSWSSSASNLAFRVFGTGADLRVKVTSGTAASELIGFGMDYVQNGYATMLGDASFEYRTISTTEASTGLVTLYRIQYTPGAHQLHANRGGYDFIAPDFTELSYSQVQFPSGFLTAGDKIRFYVQYGIVNDGSSQYIAKFAALYSAIVGSTAQYGAGLVTHSSLQAAHDSIAAGGNILVLPTTITENVTISKQCSIQGSGYASLINGTVTYAVGSSGASVTGLQFGGNVTINSGANNIIMFANWVVTGSTITDNGTNNLISSESVNASYTFTNAGAFPNNALTSLSSTYVTYSKLWDTHASFNTSQGSYTCPINGKFVFNAMVQFPSLTTGSYWMAVVQSGSVSRTVTLQFEATPSTSNSNILNGSAQFNCLVGDTLTLQALQSSGSTQSISSSGAQWNHLDITRVGN